MAQKHKRRKYRKKEESSYKNIENYLKKNLDCPITMQKIKIPHKEIDVVGYNPNENYFCAVERKPGKSVVKLGQALGQILTYQALLAEGGQEFLLNFQHHLRKSERRLIDLRKLAKNELNMKFYIAIDNEVCNNFKLLEWLKKRIPSIGIIRMKKNRCRAYFKNDRGEVDYSLSDAIAVKIPFIIFEKKLMGLLGQKGVTENVKQISIGLVELIKRLDNNIKIKYFRNQFNCALNKVFLWVHIRKKYLTLSIFRKNRRLKDRYKLIKKYKNKWALSKEIRSEREIRKLEPLLKQGFKLRNSQ